MKNKKKTANGNGSTAEVSQLGRDLRKISDAIAASGIKPLTRAGVAKEVSERRGGR